MSNELNDIVNNYYLAILEYEEFLKIHEPKTDYKGMPFMQKKILKYMNDFYERDFMPWRSLKGDIRKNLFDIFSSKDIEKIMPYLRTEDELGDILTEEAEIDLTKYYKSKGYNIYDDSIKDEIIERSLDICNEINLDSTIFSKNVLMLQPIVIKFNKVCDNLYKSYQNSLIELKEESYEVDNENEL